MSKSAKRVITLVLGALLLSSLMSGCKKEKEKEKVTDTKQTVTEKNMYEGYKLSDDMPAWTGKKLKFVSWNAQGTGSATKVIPKNDVVSAEVERITGVSRDNEKSFDNGGQDSYEVKLSKVIASGDWPNVIGGLPQSGYLKLIEEGKLWDLTEYIPKYMPNYMKTFGTSDEFKIDMNRAIVNGKNYAVAGGGYATVNAFLFDKKNYPSDFEWSIASGGLPTGSGYIFVRDDILKMIYPQAKTDAELKQMIVDKKGILKEEDFFPFRIKSAQEFFDFARKIKALGLKENGKDVVPMFTHNGGDSWTIAAMTLGLLYGFNPANQTDNNYYTYWDKKTQKVEYMFKQSWYKDAVRELNKLVRERVASPDAIIENNAQWKEKMNNGLYAIGFVNAKPDNAVYEKASKPYRYVQVYVDIKQDDSRFVQPLNSLGLSLQALVKDTVKQEDIPQILKYWDLAYTKVGQDLAAWGPKSSGLWKEVDGGKRVWVEKEMDENQKTGKSNNLKFDEYNLMGRTWYSYPYSNAKQLRTLDGYPIEITAGNALSRWQLGFVRPLQRKTTESWFIDSFSGTVPDVKKFWSARTGFENEFKKVFTASDDAQFDKLWAEMVNYAEQNGLTDKTLEEINKVFKETNKNFMNNLK
jgi:putative aldouronate transport system substrate-binding protein